MFLPHAFRRLIALIFLLALTCNAHAQIAVSPQILDLTLEEAGKTQAFRLSNLTAEAKHVKVSLSSWDLDENNQVRELAPSETSLDRWTVINPLEFTVQPAKSQVVRLAIRPAIELSKGEHRVMVFFDEIPDLAKDESSTMRVRFRIGAAVYVHVGPVSHEGTINSNTADAKGFRLNVTTSGNATTRFAGQYIIYKADKFPGKGKVLPIEGLLAADHKLPQDVVRAGRIPTTAVLPATTRTVSGEYDGGPLEPGHYVVSFIGKYGDTPLELSNDVSVTATKP